MRLGVADVGSNTVRLVITEQDGGLPLPVHTSKRRLHLAERVSADGRLAADAVECLVEALTEVKEEALRWKVTEPLVFATAAVRDAVNREEIVAAVRARTGLSLHVMSGVTEAELTFLAARQWIGWRAGPMALLDIGGGSLEVAFGRGGTPDFAASLPLGAGRLTRDYLDQDSVPAPELVRQVRRRVRHELRDVAARIQWERPRTAVATSRTFHQLGRLCGAAPRRKGPFVPRHLSRSDLKAALKTLVGLPAPDRAELPGISAGRARQCVAGAIVAHTTMRSLDIDQVVLSPWALREGVMLAHLQRDSSLNPGSTAWRWSPD
ncbi:Ppx/GppA family phosphatase [Streptomyces olivaceus]|uniref:Ppx/GppA phosphatase family protein n=1 Tax=Streptomyces olivaceus TaxID=47716 RepID=UPI00363FEBA5